MAFKILDTCIVCGKCELHCPTESIDLGDDYFEIDEHTCVECEGYYEESQCRLICPVDCIVKIEENGYLKN